MDIKLIIEKYPHKLRETIFKEIMHYEILETLFAIKDIQNALVFQGGTALRLCYNNDRYSEDLDFVIHKERDFNAEFMDFFENTFCEKITQKYHLNVEIVCPKDFQGIVQRWSAQVYLPLSNKKSKINIEIANIPSHDNQFQAIKNNYNEIINKRIFVQVETLEEILADKFIALSQRKYLKFRDLWDIEWLKSNNVNTNYDLIQLKMQDYQCKNFFESLESRKIEISKPNIENDFLREMERFLDIEYFEQIKNTHYFNSIKSRIHKEIDEILTYQKQLNTINKTTESAIKPKPPKPKKSFKR